MLAYRCVLDECPDNRLVPSHFIIVFPPLNCKLVINWSRLQTVQHGCIYYTVMAVVKASLTSEKTDYFLSRNHLKLMKIDKIDVTRWSFLIYKYFVHIYACVVLWFTGCEMFSKGVKHVKRSILDRVFYGLSDGNVSHGIIGLVGV